MDNFAIMALMATLGTWFVTALGAAMVVFFTSPNPKGLNIMLGFASGVMIAASFWSLLQPAIQRAEAASNLPAYFVQRQAFCWVLYLCMHPIRSFPLQEEKQTSHRENPMNGCTELLC